MLHRVLVLLQPWIELKSDASMISPEALVHDYFKDWTIPVRLAGW